MAIMFCLGSDYTDAKAMVQNRTTSKFADEHEWVGLIGNSIEGAHLAVINRRKPVTDYERDTFTLYPPKYSQILDQVFPD